MCKVAKNTQHNTIIGWVVIVVERELGMISDENKRGYDMNKMKNINCIHYAGGKCNHPCARGFFNQKPCVLTTGDFRTMSCSIQQEHNKPKAPPCPPPKGR